MNLTDKDKNTVDTLYNELKVTWNQLMLERLKCLLEVDQFETQIDSTPPWDNFMPTLRFKNDK